MRKTELGTPFLEGGVRDTHYFNGRILTAEDLSLEQAANRRRHRRLSQAVGEGVVRGLRVSVAAAAGQQRALAVQAGLAVNRLGDALRLPEAVEVALVTPAQISADRAGLFVECQPPSVSPVSSGTGVYVFTVGPASGLEGHAPRSSLGADQGVADSCDSRNQAEGVRFGLVRADLDQDPQIDAALLQEIQNLMASTASADLWQLRNLLAHLCLGTPGQPATAAKAFQSLSSGADGETGLLGALRAQGRLGDCEVPLGLLLWSTQGIRFVDNWAVRRHVGRGGENGPAVLHPHQWRVREAALLQFQEQLDELLSSLNSSQRSAAKLADYFAFLPPAGVVPFGGDGFNLATFWGGHTQGREVILEEREWRAVLDASLHFDSRRVKAGIPVRLFRTLQNLQPPAGITAKPEVLFASPAVMRHLHVPLSIRRGNSKLDSTALADLFRDTSSAYQGLRRIILVGQSASRPPLVAEDHLGLLLIQQVVALAQSLQERARGLSLTQESALEAFTRLAEAQRLFTAAYQNDILDSGATTRYGTAFRQMILSVEELLTRTQPQGGVNGLLQGLADFDLFSAATTQRAINQFLALQVGEFPRGNIGVQLRPGGVSPSPFGEGDVVNFRFDLNSRTNIAETYDLIPIIVADQQQAAWDAAAALFDVDLQPLRAPEIRLAATGQASVFLQIQGVPAGTADSVVRVQLTAQSKRNPSGLVGTSSQELFTVGAEGTPQAPDIEIERLRVEGNGLIDPATGRVLVAPGSSGATLILEARFQTQGLYVVTASGPDGQPPAGWVVVLLSVASYDLSGQSMPVARNIRVGLQPSAEAGDATLVVTVRDEQDNTRQRTFNQPIGVG